MPRIARVVVEGYPHHITQRGNYKQATFKDRDDYMRYLKWMERYSREYKTAVLGYSLMPNHVHFAAIPQQKNSLSRTLHTCHMRYAQYFNKKNAVAGHLWQGRFYSCALDESHLYAVIRYIENNPVRSGLVAKAEDWEWSSAREHLCIAKRKGILTLSPVSEFIDIEEWEKYLRDEDTAIESKIRANTLTGRPVGSDEFVDKLEKLSGRRLRPLPGGRPPKTSDFLETRETRDRYLVS